MKNIADIYEYTFALLVMGGILIYLKRTQPIQTFFGLALSTIIKLIYFGMALFVILIMLLFLNSSFYPLCAPQKHNYKTAGHNFSKCVASHHFNLSNRPFLFTMFL
jgi:hypothetical protein